MSAVIVSGESSWGSETLQSDRTWIGVYTARCVTETLKSYSSQALAMKVHDQQAKVNMGEIRP